MTRTWRHAAVALAVAAAALGCSTGESPGTKQHGR